MPKFAVYYVPPADDEFYHLGTSILGYDVRARESVQMPKELSDRLGGFNPDWVLYARPYGFHLTIGAAIDFDFGRIWSIEGEIYDILNCFDSDHHFTLQQNREHFVAFWGKRKQVVALRYDPSDYLKILHTLVVARVQTLGTGSTSLQDYLREPERYADRPHLARRLLKFYYGPVLDNYTPHFTLLNPYTGTDHEVLAHAFSEMFSHFSQMTAESVCLLVQMHEDENWKVYREFKLNP